jgi:hypothetical protein
MQLARKAPAPILLLLRLALFELVLKVEETNSEQTTFVQVVQDLVTA